MTFELYCCFHSIIVSVWSAVLSGIEKEEFRRQGSSIVYGIRYRNLNERHAAKMLVRISGSVDHLIAKRIF